MYWAWRVGSGNYDFNIQGPAAGQIAITESDFYLDYETDFTIPYSTILYMSIQK